jgi:hypothetical protein
LLPLSGRKLANGVVAFIATLCDKDFVTLRL